MFTPPPCLLTSGINCKELFPLLSKIIVQLTQFFRWDDLRLETSGNLKILQKLIVVRSHKCLSAIAEKSETNVTANN